MDVWVWFGFSMAGQKRTVPSSRSRGGTGRHWRPSWTSSQASAATTTMHTPTQRSKMPSTCSSETTYLCQDNQQSGSLSLTTISIQVQKNPDFTSILQLCSVLADYYEHDQWSLERLMVRNNIYKEVNALHFAGLGQRFLRRFWENAELSSDDEECSDSGPSKTSPSTTSGHCRGEGVLHHSSSGSGLRKGGLGSEGSSNRSTAFPYLPTFKKFWAFQADITSLNVMPPA